MANLKQTMGAAAVEPEPDVCESDSSQGSVEMPDAAKSTSGSPSGGATSAHSWESYVLELNPPAEAFKKSAAEHLINPPVFPKLALPENVDEKVSRK